MRMPCRGLRHFRAAAQAYGWRDRPIRQIMRRRLAAALAQIVADLREMTRGFLAVDVVQHRIHRGRHGTAAVARARRSQPAPRGVAVSLSPALLARRSRRGCRRGQRCEQLCACSRIPSVGDTANACASRPSAYSARRDFLDGPAGRSPTARPGAAGRATADCADRHHSGRARQRLVDDPVQQILDRPGEFGDQAGADHAAAALQGVEAAAHVRPASPDPSDSGPTAGKSC